MPSPPREAPDPYTYDHLTDDVLSTWQESGRQSIMSAFTQAEDQEMVAGALIQELIRSSIDRRMPAQDAGAVLKDVLQSLDSDEQRQELQSLVADTINILEDRDWKTSALRDFVAAASISPDILREELDVETLQALGLVRNTFSTMRNRKTTNLIYRQANFNLLREESEGYSKLITEYFNVSHVDNLSEPVAEDAFERIKAIIGSFDLDVGRVFDITLDLMSNLLVKNNRFFVKFLRASSWWPEDNIPDAIEWTGQNFTSLPTWARPHSGAWNNSSEERERLASLRLTRDLAFWDRLKESGMDAFFELGARRITNMDSPVVKELLSTELQPELNARGQDTNYVRRTRINSARTWMRETGCLPPPGNPDAAQILGFKLAFYASDARDKNDEMPENLIWMSALLIKIGFISLRDLYPHLHPSDEQMPEIRTKMQQEKEQRERALRPGVSVMNALAKAGALADDTPTLPAVRALREADKGASSPKPDATSNKDATKPAEELPEPPNQKVLLLKSLLLIGALPEALFILGRFPWLADLVDDLPAYIHRILHHMLSKLNEATRPLSDRTGMSDPKDHLGDPAGLPKGDLKFVPAKRPRLLKWALLERGDIGDEVEYRFYWDDWADNIPICQTVDDVLLTCSTLLNYSGVKIGKDPALLSKLTRIGKMSLADDPSATNYSRWIDLSKRLLVPALSLTKANSGVVNEVYELLKLFSIDVRYSIYSEWHSGAVSRNPDIQSAFKLTEVKTKDCLKRLSKETQKTMGKALSKVALSSPGIVIQLTIHQLESYDNIIECVVECWRYFSMLGYDVLNWALITALGAAGRNRVQADGMLTSSWLRALSTFAGKTFAKYAAIDPTPILQYVANEIREGNSTDLELLDQIITNMVGIRSDVVFSESQVLAMAGGAVLQAQTLISVADKRHDLRRTASRLMKALLNPGLIGQLLISIAQERQMYPNHEESKFAPLKVLGSNVDKINDVFHQYLDAVRSSMPPKEFDAAVPDVVSLIKDFGIEPSIAFEICRASIAAAVAEIDTTKEIELQQSKTKPSIPETPATNGDIAMADADEKPAEDIVAETNGTPSEDAEMKDVKEIEQANGVLESTTAPALTTVDEEEAQPWHPALTPIIEKMQHVMGTQFESIMNIPFYVTFWSLSLEDILVNSASYEQELAAQNYLMHQVTNDRTDTSAQAARTREAKKKAIIAIKPRLTQEMRDQIKTYQRVRSRLLREKSHWFSSLKVKPDVLQHSLLQNCFLPRVLLSPLDAHYTFTLIKFLHNNCTPGFRTLYLYDHLLRKNQLAALMYQCTAREAENFGRFLNEVLKDLLTWHAKEDQYEKNAFGVKKNLPGFAKKVHADGSPEAFLVYEDFRRLLYKWHSNLNGAFQMCFQSGEYMHVRNAIVVLKAITQHFPVVNFMGNKMVEEVTRISKEDQRGDLKLSAMSLIGNLKRLEKTWMLPQAFRIVSIDIDTLQRRISDETQKNNAIPAQKAETSRSGTPVAGNGIPLNPAASEFKPVTGDAPPAPDGGRSEDGEDGEIDEKKVDAPEAEAPAPKEEAPATIEQKVLPASLPKKPEPKAAPAISANASAPPSRPSSTQPPARPPHGLPARPDSRIQPPRSLPAERMDDRNRPSRRDDRSREPPRDYGRLEPPTDVPSNRSREASPGRRSRARTPERDYTSDRRDYGPSRADDRSSSRMQPQDSRMSDRDTGYGPSPNHDGAHTVHPSRLDSRSIPSMTGSMPPPSQPDRTHTRSERAGPTARLPNPSNDPLPAQTSQPSTPLVNPERLARIQDDGTAPRNDRRPRDEPRRIPSERRDQEPRRQSPRRADPPPAQPEQKSEPRRAPLAPNPFAEARTAPRDRRDEPRRDEPRRDEPRRDEPRRDEPRRADADHAPTGPRNGRSGRAEQAPSRGDLFEYSGPPRRPTDPSHGRLNPDHGSGQETNYGRLNSDPDPPSQPRNFTGPPQSGGRNFTPSGPGGNARSGQGPSNAPADSSGRRPLPQQGTGNRPPYGRSAAPSSAPSGPSASSPQHSAAAPAGVHFSRLAQLPIDQAQSTPSGPRGNGQPTSSSRPASVTDSPASRTSAPSGPSAGDRKRLAGINDTLAGNGSNSGASIKGRAGRQSTGPGPASPSVSGAPTGPGNSMQNGRGQGPAQQTQVAPPVHPSRLEAIGGNLNSSTHQDHSSGRREDERADRHRSSRDDDRSRHNGAAADSRDDYRSSERDSRGGRSTRSDNKERGERNRDGRNDRDHRERGGGGSERIAGQLEPPALASAIQMPSSFSGPPPAEQGYPGGRGYDGRGPSGPSAGGRSSDWPRRGGGGSSSGPPARDGGNGGGGQSRDGGRGDGGRGGSDRKRRGEEMHDRERSENKRRRSGV